MMNDTCSIAGLNDFVAQYGFNILHIKHFNGCRLSIWQSLGQILVTFGNSNSILSGVSVADHQ